MYKKILIFFITMFGIGNSKFVPGTVASFVTCLIYIILFYLKVNIFFLVIINLVIFILSVFLIDFLKNFFSNVDAREIVIDEFIGQSIPILSFYSFLEKENISIFIVIVFVSFILFRIFDILKPYPINLVDKKIKNGFGVMLDDVIAGIFSSILMLIIYFNI
jgi:phosphatidylglycerophosphatase A